MNSITFNDVPFVGDAMATWNGQVIWTNHISGDCPPDLCSMIVKSMYVIDDIMVFDLKMKGE